MPRYFFHLSFGQRVLPDEEGVELPSRTAARNEALAAVRELVNPDVGSAPNRWASWFVDVADEAGRFFRTPLGHPALELVPPDAAASPPKLPDLKPVRQALATAPHGEPDR